MKTKEKKVLIQGYSFWPLAFLPWVVGVVVIVKAVIQTLI